MWWSSATLLPQRLTMAIAATAASIAGFVAALAVFLLLEQVEREGRLLSAMVAYPAVVLGAAALCGLVIGLATASGVPHGASLRRGAASAGALLLLGLALVGVYVVRADAESRDFSAADFRAAAAGQDLEALADQASKAVESRALVGMSAARVRQELGPPPRVGRRRHVYIWELGMINDFLGPGDAGRLYVEFDRSWRQVRSARIEPGLD